MALVDAGFVVPIPEFLSTLKPKMLSQGAEALTMLVQSPVNRDQQCVAKFRPSKAYRIEQLDKQLRKRRTTAEVKVLQKLQAAEVPCPAYIKDDLRNGLVYMEFIEGPTLKSFTWDLKDNTEAMKPFFRRFGQIVAKMHQVNVTHGDLTTSNAIVSGKELKLIDFGLSNMSANIEDKAVDIYVLERAVESTHAKYAKELVAEVLLGYQQDFTDVEQYNQIMHRLENVRQRGRKRSMLG